MGFFEKSESGELPPIGHYWSSLKELKIEAQPSFDDPNLKTQRSKFVFETTTLDRKSGKPILIIIWTGTRYGNPKASLTKLLDMMLPKMTAEQRAEVTREQLLGRKCRGSSENVQISIP